VVYGDKKGIRENEKDREREDNETGLEGKKEGRQTRKQKIWNEEGEGGRD